MKRAHSTQSDQDEAPPRAPVPALCLLHVGDAGILSPPPVIVLGEGATPLGREAPGGPALADGRLSRLHAVVQVHPGGGRVEITDQGSKNGTFLNGRRVIRGQLRDGDLIRVGGSLLLLRLLSAAPPEDREEQAADGLIGSSPALRTLRRTLRQVAPTSATVLLIGETGTGKELAARALHRRSGVRGPLVPVNCSAIPEALAESQIFGHLARAVTGANAQEGFFRAAHQGTLFLDEIADLPPAIQPKLLRAIEERAVVPLGAVAPVGSEVRLVAASGKDLREEALAGRFRGDLYARLAEVILHLPPLRERREDILQIFAHAAGPEAPRLAPRLAEALVLDPWRYNVRELCKLASDLRLRVGHDEVWTLDHVSGRLQPGPAAADGDAGAEGAPAAEPPAPNFPPLAELERLLREHGGQVTAMARAVGYSRKQVYRWLAHHQLDPRRYRAPGAPR